MSGDAKPRGAVRNSRAYRSSPTRRRRSQAQIAEIRKAIYDFASDPTVDAMTVRQLFYRLVSSGLIEKTEPEYKQTVVRLCTQMRLDGELPWRWIADNSRWMRKPRTYSGLGDFLDTAASAYRRALWEQGEEYIEVWLEKEALSGVIFPVTAEWDVPLMVTRGYPSLTFLHEAAEELGERDQWKTIYYLGDWDPSGLDIARNVEERLDEFDASIDRFERLAVTAEQIATWELPTRPTKRTDSRAAQFAGASVEVDAIEPAALVSLVRDAILGHVDQEAYAKLRAVEESERSVLRRIGLDEGSL